MSHLHRVASCEEPGRQLPPQMLWQQRDWLRSTGKCELSISHAPSIPKPSLLLMNPKGQALGSAPATLESLKALVPRETSRQGELWSDLPLPLSTVVCLFLLPLLQGPLEWGCTSTMNWGERVLLSGDPSPNSNRDSDRHRELSEK